MPERFSNKQVTAMVAGIAAAVVLAPAAVYAAATTVWVADPTTGKRARVTNSGSLAVESRAGIATNSFNVQGARLGVGWIPLKSTTLPNRVAITELTITPQGPAGPQVYRLETWMRKPGVTTGSCSQPNLTEFQKTVHRQVSTQNYATIQQLFNGPPLLTPTGAAGQLVCFGVVSIQAPSGSESHVSVSGYVAV